MTVTTPHYRVSGARIARGEWIKLISVRSTLITLFGGAFATVLFGVVFSLTASSGGAPAGPGALLTDPVAISLGAVNLSQLIVGVVGVLTVAGEYSTGLIRSTFAAVRSRIGVLSAKVAVLGGTVFALMAVATTIAVALGQAVYTGDQPTVSLADAGVVRVLFGATTYLTGVALMGVALGFILRSTAGGIAMLVGSLFILPTLLTLLPEGFTDTVLRYFPSKAGESMMAMNTQADLLSVWSAFGVFATWVVALLAVAAVQLRKRDA